MGDATLAAQMRAPVLSYLLLMLAAGLAGLAVLAIMPPFEGFDETAHWSTLQQVADTGHSPVYGLDTISTDIARYRGPTPYSAPGLAAPALTYERFRLAGAPALTMRPGAYGRGGFRNWEAQHPPLYYRVLAPLYGAAKGLVMRDHIMVLRLASWMLAVAGLALGAEGARRFLPDGAKIALVIAAWPLLVPEFLPEMARLGNDSLCLLFAGGAWAVLMRLLSPRGGWGSAAALGILLGLGLLTKALFLPIVAGTGTLLGLKWLRERTLSLAIQFALAIGLAAAIGLWWYIARHAATGSFSGSDEFIQFQQHSGGFFVNLGARFSFLELLKGVTNIVVGFIWGGTWSLAQPHTVLLLGPALLIAAPMIIWLKNWREMGWSDLAAALWIVPLAASLVYHVLVLIAFTGSGVGTPGHYLHIVAPAFGLAVARGWRWRWAGVLLIGGTALFTAYIWIQELALFSGCAGKNSMTNHYVFDQACFIDVHSLGALAHPGVALGSLLLSLVCLGMTLVRLRGSIVRATTVGMAELKPLFDTP